MIFQLTLTHLRFCYLKIASNGLKRKDEDFDAPVVCYDGAEMCKLLGIILIHQLNDIDPKKKFRTV